MSAIEIRGLTKEFRPGARALDSIDLDVADGELLAVVGPSGSGKTTLLRLLAGLDAPTAGTIRVDGKDLAGVPPHERNVALVFQDLALYGHLSVAGNLAFGLKDDPNGERIGQTARALGIDHLLDRFPAELSGGEQQRVALGRAIVRQPAVLLLDEPLSGLDAPVRRRLRRELKRLQQQLRVPMIYVTHNQEEALALGDRVAMLFQGKLAQVGRPNELYWNPARALVGVFFGPQGMNLLAGTLERSGAAATFQADDWRINLDEYSPRTIAGEVVCGFRPESLLPGIGDLVGRVNAIESLGEAIYVQAEVAGARGEPQYVVARQRDLDRTPPKPGTVIPLDLDPSRLVWFDRQTGVRVGV